ncbi:hypothetical protein HWV62_23262 [Athelia sp. TMB]|nr:hypothetical protein HWV62_23262 [Athelia sp. TMB]
MDGTQVNSLRIFKNICGDTMSGVAIISSMWSDINSDLGVKREEELKGAYWKEYMEYGCLTGRFDDSHESALNIIGGMVGSPGMTLSLQKEIVDEGKALSETKAAQSISALRAIIKFCKNISGWNLGTKG